MITPSNHQLLAIKAIVEWFFTPPDQRAPFFYLGGFAGTGKTELAKFIIQELGLAPHEVAGAAFSGKAALMMKVRGFPTAGTIHSLIYRILEKGKGRAMEMQAMIDKLVAEKAFPHLIERARKELRDEINGLRKMAWMLNVDSELRNLKLLVLDEVSMVGESIGTDLLSFGTPILCLGDPGQLPPVADGAFFTAGEPDFFLTEIHRQARDSAIIRMATQAREEGWITPGVYKDPSGFDSVAAYVSDAERTLEASQILVGRNATRHNVNAWWRTAKGYRHSLPMSGEKIICLRNNHELGLLNGGFYTMREDTIEDGDMEDGKCLLKIVSQDFPDQGNVDVIAHKIMFGGDKDSLAPWMWSEAESFDFGPSITVHKAQGSQFEHVVLNAEWPNKESWKAWLYTGITRSQLSTYIKLPR